jgi:DNA-binding NarL/FixJ family response regulator
MDPLITPSAAVKARVLIVEDHPMFRERLTDLVNKEPDMKVCGAADNVRDALVLIQSLDAQVVVIDISLKGASGLELIKDIVAHDLSLPVLVLSMHEENLYAERALRAGAKGYISKQEPSDRIISAIRQVLSGETYLSPKAMTKIVSALSNSRPNQVSGVSRLTDRELEVFGLIGRGQTTREIGVRLSLGASTVETYRARIKNKLSLANGSQLSHEAIRWVESGQGSPV